VARMDEESFSYDILDGNYTRINGYDDFEIQKNLKRTPDQESIILAVNESQKEIKSERTAVIFGLLIAGVAAFMEIKAIIKLVENEQANLPNNGIIIGGVFIAIICGFVIKRIFELIGLSRFKFLAIEYLEKEQPTLALDLYKSEKILVK